MINISNSTVIFFVQVTVHSLVGNKGLSFVDLLVGFNGFSEVDSALSVTWLLV